MIKHKITIYHYYQDIHNPTKQIIIINGDYGIRYALFMALIDSHVKFDIEILKKENGE